MVGGMIAARGTHAACCNQTGDGCWELFCLERGLQLDEHLLSDKTVCGGDGSGYPLLERFSLGYGKNSRSCDMEGTMCATLNGRIVSIISCVSASMRYDRVLKAFSQVNERIPEIVRAMRDCISQGKLFSAKSMADNLRTVIDRGKLIPPKYTAL